MRLVLWLARAGLCQCVRDRIPGAAHFLFRFLLGPLTYGPTSQPTFCSSGLRFFLSAHSSPTQIRDTYAMCRARTVVSTLRTVMITYFHVSGSYWSNTQVPGLNWTLPATTRIINAIISLLVQLALLTYWWIFMGRSMRSHTRLLVQYGLILFILVWSARALDCYGNCNQTCSIFPNYSVSS